MTDIDDLVAAMALLPKPEPTDVVRLEVGRAQDVTRLAPSESRWVTERRRIGLLPPAVFTGLPVVVSQGCPPDVVVLVARDGSTTAISLTTRQFITAPTQETTAP